jgi:hypothetical protein
MYPLPGGRLQPGSALVFTGVIKDLKSNWAINLRFKDDQKVSYNSNSSLRVS